MQQFQDGLVFKAETCSYLRLIDSLYHSTLGSRVIKKRKRRVWRYRDTSLLDGFFWARYPCRIFGLGDRG